MGKQTDKPSNSAGGPAKKGGARRATDKTEKNQQVQLCGWNLPVIPDDNDIVGWMKREKNGENKRKKVNEVFVDEQYRHVLDHCAAIENKLLFDRQSLHDRYLRNCQFGVRDARAAKVMPVASLPVASSAREGQNPAPYPERERNCMSASAIAYDRGILYEEDGEGGDEGEGLGGEGEGVSDVLGEVGGSRARRRSQSALCSAVLRKCGMTLPESRPVTVRAADEVKDEGEDGDLDEGYGSKVSSNDHEHDPVEDDNVQNEDDDDDDEETPRPEAPTGDYAEVSPGNENAQYVANGLEQAHQVISHQDALAKLMYSRRERTVYERLPNRRMRGNAFRYAGREQSRLTEASLSHITPAYLARYHHLATTSQARLAPHVTHERMPQQQQNSTHVSDNNSGGFQPRTMVLRKIIIQDSKDLFSQNVEPAYNNSNPKASPTGSRAQGQRSPKRSETSVVSETKSCPPRGMLRVQNLTSDLSSEMNSEAPPTTLTSSALTVSSLSVPQNSDDGTLTNGGTPRLYPSGRSGEGGSGSGNGGGGSDKFSSSVACFQMTDLLPAVESNIRHRRTTQRGLDKSRTLDSINIVSMQARKQQLQQQHTRIQYQGTSDGVVVDGTGRLQYGANVQVAAGHADPVRMVAVDQQVQWTPGFRPHHAMTPLQRAKEISNRRLHGHLTQLPDGTETVRVPSPRYASKADQHISTTRAKSASRLLGQVLSRHYLGSNSAV